MGTGQGLGEQSCSGAGKPFGSLNAECHLWLRLKDNSTVQAHRLQEAKGEGTSRKAGKDARDRRS